MRWRTEGTNWEGRHWTASTPIGALATQVDALHPAGYPTDGTVAGKQHDKTSPTSDHRPRPFTGIVRAIDIGVTPAQGAELTEALRTNRDLRIKYVIFDGQTFSSYESVSGPAWKWRPYNGSNPHATHIHVSVRDEADGQGQAWVLTSTTPVTGGDEMTIIKTLKGQNMAFYRALQAKTGTPGGNASYWGSDWAGAKPSDAEWEEAADDLLGAALQTGVFAPPPIALVAGLKRGDMVQLT